MSEPTNPIPRWTTGPIVTNKTTAPVIVVDCSDWPQLMEVTVTFDRDFDAPSLARMVTTLLENIDALDHAQGGTGFRKTRAKTQGKQVTLTLAPIEPEQAKARIAAICQALTEPTKAPAEVKSVTARVA